MRGGLIGCRFVRKALSQSCKPPSQFPGPGWFRGRESDHEGDGE